MSGFEKLSAETREGVGKGSARTLRRTARIPAIVYGGEGEPLPISVEFREFRKEYHRAGFFTRLYDLKVGDDSIRVLPREVHRVPAESMMSSTNTQCRASPR